MSEQFDLSDLLASIEVWFRVLSYFEPEFAAGWNHPTLIGWMAKHGYSRRRDIPPPALWLISQSLERRYRTRHKPDRLAVRAEP